MIEEHTIEGVRVNIYNPDKTVADCFIYRNKTGLDAALEALRDCTKEKLCRAEVAVNFYQCPKPRNLTPRKKFLTISVSIRK